ncbi:MAG: molybdate ABC transporter permease subunit [Hyphomicrobiaceae bacterium]|nr:molybdate ABC transporter permease subunit [Hyphomicrobiaceae bacterium]
MLQSLSIINYGPILLTLHLATISLAIMFMISMPLAWWLANTKSRLGRVVETLTALPLVLPPSVLGFYLLVFLGKGSFIGETWTSMTGEPLVFTFSGLVIASCIYSLPFVVQPLQAGFEALDKRTIEASLSLGASSLRTFLDVMLPNMRRSLVVASVLGFAHTVGEFGVVLMVGGNIPGETQVISIAIYEHVESIEYEAAHLLSLMLLAFSFVVLLAVYGTQGVKRESTIA